MIQFILTLSFLSFSQTPVYSWQDCIDMSVKNNADILVGYENLSATKQLETRARSPFLPEVNLSLGGSRRDENIKDGPVTIPGESYSASVNASQNVFAGFRDYANVKAAKFNTQSVEYNLRIIKARISFDLKSSYQSLMYAKEFHKLTQDIIRRRQDNMRLVELRYDNGRENKGSLLLARAYYAQAQYDDLVAINQQISSRVNLARALGIDEVENFDIQGMIPTNPPPPRANMQELAVNTPEHQQAVAQAEAADFNVVSNRSPFFPTLDLTASVTKNDTHIFPERQEIWTVGFNVSYPLFRGFRDIANVRNAAHNASAAHVNRVSIDRQLLTKLTQAYNNYVEAVTRFEVDKSFREATQVRAEIARNKYNNGLLTFEDWDVIESDLINRQKAYLTSLRDKTVAEATWEQAQGQGVIP